MDNSIAQATLTRFNWIQLAGWLTLTITTTATGWISKFRKVFFVSLNLYVTWMSVHVHVHEYGFAVDAKIYEKINNNFEVN